MNQTILNTKKQVQFRTTRFVLLIIFILFALIPLISMFLNITLDNFQTVIFSEGFGEVLSNSLFSASISTLLSATLAYLLAVLTERTNLAHKNFFRIVFILPMLIPSISHGMGLVILLGNNGILTNLFNFHSGIYGLKGIILGSVLYSFPVAYLMFSDIMRYENSSPYEAAEVLGIPRIKQFKDIAFPYIKKPLISILFGLFTLIITDYGVPLMVGGKYRTLSIVMYQEVIGQLNFGKGAVYGLFLLLPAIVAFALDLKIKKDNNQSYITKQFSNNGNGNKISFTICTIISIIIFLPLLAFAAIAFFKKYPVDLNLTLNNFIGAINLNAGKYLLNSLLIAIVTALIGVSIAFITAYLSSRNSNHKTSKILHLLALSTAAIPGLVLGLSYVLTFKNSFIYGTFIILIIVNMIHFISSPYMMMYNSLAKINNNLEVVGEIMGINRLRMIKDVFIPMCKSTLLEMFSFYFVNCMMTISAVSFLSNAVNRPVSLLINQFEAQMQIEYAAVVSLMIFIANILVKYLIKKIQSSSKY